MKNIFILSLTAGILFTSCVNDTFKDPVNECVDPSLVANKTVQDIYNSAISTGVKYPNDDIIEAVITSSDEGGNFFKTVSLMSLDGTRGFSMSIDDYNLYTQNFQPGKKVYVKMKDLHTMIPTGGARGLNLGGPPAGSFGTLERIGATEYKKYIIPTCKVIDEETYVKHVTVAQLNNDALLNTLVEVDNVQFVNEGVTYGNNPNDTTDKNESITDGTSTIITRTSRFANFAGSIVPSGRGKIRGVLTKFNSTYQLILRTERDVKLTNPRVDYFPPVVGNAITFPTTLSENFESYTAGSATTGQFNFPKYINDPAIGSKMWRCRSLTTPVVTKYIEMSSFGSPSENNRTLFIVPVNMTGTNKLSFKTRMSFYTGPQLKVYYSTDYVVGGDIRNATLINITSNFFISDGTNSNFNSSIPTGGSAFTLPNVGNAFIIFEYIGSGISSPVMTTNAGIDDILVN